MAAVDRDKLLAFLRERVESRNVTETSGLVIASVYQGMVTRILSGEFDEKPEVEEGPIEKCSECGREEFGHSWLDHVK